MRMLILFARARERRNCCRARGMPVCMRMLMMVVDARERRNCCTARGMPVAIPDIANEMVIVAEDIVEMVLVQVLLGVLLGAICFSAPCCCGNVLLIVVLMVVVLMRLHGAWPLIPPVVHNDMRDQWCRLSPLPPPDM